MTRLNRSLLLALVAMMVLCVTADGQRRRRQAKPTFTHPRTEMADSLMTAYLFQEAKDIIDEDITQATEGGYNTDTLEQAATLATLGINMLEAAQKVVVVDSFVIDRQQMLQTITPDPSCGTLLTAHEIKEALSLRQTPAGVGYINDFGDQIIYSEIGPGGTSRLMGSIRFGDSWSTPQPLEGLEDTAAVTGYPYLLDDGTTFYFAARNDESQGGCDIYTTRYNTETKQYLKPENMGMPFNSLWNDYLMVIDPVNRLGWFVSDRYQPADKVCVYVFIPTDVRETYNVDLGEDYLRALASLRQISLTQAGHTNEVAQAKARLAQAQAAQPATQQADDFRFDVAYGVRYTSLAQFKNTQARQMANELTQLWHKRRQLTSLLGENRQKYHDSNSPTEQKAMAPMILRQEKELDELNKQVRNLENNIRAAEAKAK